MSNTQATLVVENPDGTTADSKVTIERQNQSDDDAPTKDTVSETTNPSTNPSTNPNAKKNRKPSQSPFKQPTNESTSNNSTTDGKKGVTKSKKRIGSGQNRRSKRIAMQSENNPHTSSPWHHDGLFTGQEPKWMLDRIAQKEVERIHRKDAELKENGDDEDDSHASKAKVSKASGKTSRQEKKRASASQTMDLEGDHETDLESSPIKTKAYSPITNDDIANLPQGWATELVATSSKAKRQRRRTYFISPIKKIRLQTARQLRRFLNGYEMYKDEIIAKKYVFYKGSDEDFSLGVKSGDIDSEVAREDEVASGFIVSSYKILHHTTNNDASYILSLNLQELPKGWTTELVASSGNAKRQRRRTFFISPEKKIRLNSRKQVKKFLEGLELYDNDEEKAKRFCFGKLVVND